MAVIVTTSSPKSLLVSIKRAISDGKIVTWSCDTDGDFTHSPEQWRHKAWLRPVVVSDQLLFRILAPKGTAISKEVYGVYHGRFIEMLLVHFDDSFVKAESTALPANGDVVRSS